MNEPRREELRTLLRTVAGQQPGQLESTWDETLGDILRARFAADELSVSVDFRERALQRMRVPEAAPELQPPSNGKHTGIAILLTKIKVDKEINGRAVSAALLIGLAAILVVAYFTSRSHDRGIALTHLPTQTNPIVKKGRSGANGMLPEKKRSFLVRRPGNSPAKQFKSVAPNTTKDGLVAETVKVGTVEQAVGSPTVNTLGTSSTSIVKSGTTLVANSVLETGDADKLEFKLRDGTRLRLGFNTRIRIPQTAAAASRPSHITLYSGQLWAAVRHHPSQTFAVLTPVATANVVGTEFGLDVRRKGADRTQLEAVLSVAKGRVQFSNRFGSVMALDMTMSKASADSGPTQPVRVASLRSFRMAGYVEGGHFSAPTVVATIPRLSLEQAKVELAFPLSPESRDDPPKPKVRPALRQRIQDLAAASAKGNQAVAEAGLRSLLADRPEAAAANNLGVVLELWDRPGEAVQMYRLAIREQPGSALFHSNLARVLLTIGNLKRAVEELGTATRLAPSWSLAKTHLAEAYGLAGDVDAALRLARSIASSAPDWNSLASSGNVMMRAASSFTDNPSAYRGLMGEAENLFRKALRLEPHEYQVLLDLSGLLIADNRTSEAEPYVRDAVRVNPTYPDAWTMLGIVLASVNKTGEAEAAYREALRLAPSNALARYNLGEMLVDLGRLDDAIPQFEAAVKQDSTDAESYSLLGDIYRQKREFAKAEAKILKSLALAPKSSRFVYELGLLCKDRREWKKAADLLTQAVRLDSQNNDALVQLAKVECRLNRLEEAENLSRTAIKLFPDDWQGHDTLGDVYRRERLLDRAIAEHREAVKLGPKESVPLAGLGLDLLIKGEPEEAENLFGKSAALDSKNAEAHAGLGQALARRGNVRAAETEFRRAIELDPNDGLGYAGLGRLFETTDSKEAEKAFRGWVAIADNPEADAALACFLADHGGQLTEARKYASAAIALDRENPLAWDAAGWVDFKLDKIESAEMELLKAASLAAHDHRAQAPIQEHLGLLRAKKNRGMPPSISTGFRWDLCRESDR